MISEEADPARALRVVAGQLAAGVTVVISLGAEGEPHATTATSFVPVSREPPLVAVFFAAGSRMRAHLERSGRFTVNLLGAEDLETARRLARPGRASGWDGLVGVALTRRDPAPPALAHALGWLDCAVERRIPLGDHGGFVGRVLAGGRRTDVGPLLAHRGRFHELGAPLAPAPWTEYDEADLVAHW